MFEGQVDSSLFKLSANDVRSEKIDGGKEEEYIEWYDHSFRVLGFYISTFLFPSRFYIIISSKKKLFEWVGSLMKLPLWVWISCFSY